MSDPAPTAPRPNSIFTCLLVFIIAAASIYGGLRLRRVIWARSAPIHHEDAADAFGWGKRILEHASIDPAIRTNWKPFLGSYLHVYDDVRAAHPDGDYQLDAPPLRLLIVALWARGERAATWSPRWDLNAPLLYFTAACDLASAIGIYLLVRRFARGHRASSAASGTRWARLAPLLPLAGAVLFWFNPALLLDGYAWPQWDGWILPFFLFAALGAASDRWLAAGALLAVGAMLKMQLLLVAPLWLLWPLFDRRPRAALRALTGFVLVFGLIASPWLARRSMAWLDLSLIHPLRFAPQMTLDASNLPAILASKGWDWQTSDIVWTVHPPHTHAAWPLHLRTLLIAVTAVGLILSALGAARANRVRDPRFLAAIVAPWLIAVALLPQMHGRYLLWSAALGALWVGLSLEMTLLHVLLTALACVMILRPLYASQAGAFPKAARVLGGLHPNIGWMIVLFAIVVLWEALVGLPRRRRVALPIV